MKVIELLNKIANEGDLPKKIKYDGEIFIYGNVGYKTENSIYLDDILYGIDEYETLNDEVEILEDNIEKIEEMLINGRDIEFGSMSKWLGNTSLHEEKISSTIDCIGIKLNEVIRVVNELRKESDN